jgi:hypothetical protein
MRPTAIAVLQQLARLLQALPRIGGRRLARLAVPAPGSLRAAFHPADKLAHHRLRLRANKLIHHATAAKRLHRRNALDAVLHRQARILVGIDFGQSEAAVRLVSQPLQHRTEHATRAAPGRPEVDDDRLLV